MSYTLDIVSKSVLYTLRSVKKCFLYMERIRHFLPGGLKLSNVATRGRRRFPGGLSAARAQRAATSHELSVAME